MTRTALKLKIEGMHCDACVRRVTTALQKLPTVQLDHVKIGEASLDFDASRVQPHEVIHALDVIGFKAEVA
jgi:copper chaperone